MASGHSSTGYRAEGLRGNLCHIGWITLMTTSSLGSNPPSRTFDQNPSHRLGRSPEKMPAVLPCLPFADESQIGFMNQCGGLEGMI